MLELNRLVGEMEVEFGEETVCKESLGIIKVKSNWLHGGMLEGPTNLTLSDGKIMEGLFNRGVAGGLFRTFRCQECEDDVDDEVWHLESLLEYKEGQVDIDSLAFWFPVGGGLVQCRPDNDILANGHGCVYLYPDLVTGLVGDWVGGRMVNTRQAELVDLDMSTTVIRLVMEIVGDEIYSEDISTSTKISIQPLLEDPFERKTIYVAESSYQSAGEGLFLRCDLEIGDLAAIYNGVRMTDMESRLRKEDRRSVYRVHGWDNTILNIPSSDSSMDIYKASLGHKANHATKPKAEFKLMLHPRFGEIVGLYMVEKGVAGEEVTINYGYTDRYLATQAGIQMMLEAARTITGYNNKQEFHSEMKRTIGYVREKVDEMKPFIKMAKSFMT